jgi:type I restriction enzyme S subunit
MRDGWVEATLGEALEPIANRPNGKDYPLVLSVTEKRGIIPQTEIFNNRIATDDISKYKVLEPMDIAYNPYLLWCGAIGQWQGTEAGVVSPVYECFRVKSNCEPRYLGYIFETGILTNYFDALAIGSIVRRRRTIPSDFIAAPIQLPPLPEQKRIVDLISSVDSYIETLQQQLESAKRFRNAVLHELLTAGGDDWVETTLGNVADWSSGKNISKNSRVLDGEYSIIGANGEIGRTDQFLYDQPLVVVGRVGSCGETYLIHGKVWISDNALIALPNANIEINYLYYLLKTFDYKKIISGTTQPLITQGKLKTQSVFLPPLPEQKRIVEIVNTIDVIISQTELTTNKAQNLRSGLLLDLLSGEHLIPSSYDKVIGAA